MRNWAKWSAGCSGSTARTRWHCLPVLVPTLPLTAGLGITPSPPALQLSLSQRALLQGQALPFPHPSCPNQRLWKRAPHPRLTHWGGCVKNTHRDTFLLHTCSSGDLSPGTLQEGPASYCPAKVCATLLPLWPYKRCCFPAALGASPEGKSPITPGCPALMWSRNATLPVPITTSTSSARTSPLGRMGREFYLGK